MRQPYEPYLRFAAACRRAAKIFRESAADWARKGNHQRRDAWLILARQNELRAQWFESNA